MVEYKINDDWVLQRVSKESKSFSQWTKELIETIKKAVGEQNPEIAQELEKSEQNLPEMVEIDNRLQKVHQRLEAYNKGILGNIITSVTDKIEGLITSNLAKTGVLTDKQLDFNLDYLTGKRKTLSSTLYDVAKERGINSEGILYLIKSLPDLESFLYSTSGGKFYRDHTEHQLRVAVLGDFLLEQDLGNGTLLNIISDISEIDKEIIKEEIWWVTGLIHDIGYPLQKLTTSVNWSLINQILKCYPLLDLEISPLEVSLFTQDKSFEEYLKILEEGLTKQAKLLIREGSGANLENFPQPEKVIFQTSKESGHTEYSYTNQIPLDHGVIGAISLLRSLGTPQEIKEKKDELKGYILSAQAIALHNFKDRINDFNFDSNPLNFLLVMIDEMQEWGRPIPVQILDSYFTTEFKKISLLDEVKLIIDDFEWLFAYKNQQAKKLIDFKFQRICDGKQSGFQRLDRGKEFRETEIILQNYNQKEITEQLHFDNDAKKSMIKEMIKTEQQKELQRSKSLELGSKKGSYSLTLDELDEPKISQLVDELESEYKIKI
ncbi:MAG: hypothetical protein FK734_09995 [Asgard group archaeon]|nr:hypothetical protein [Asgard group archaeon]